MTHVGEGYGPVGDRAICMPGAVPGEHTTTFDACDGRSQIAIEQ
ncbi:hypothetical protein HMPREF1531_01584 [Propionibacterium sp. oral taxon 192 str. F0372]|nr:hypothetical protein HMPREF1531_01584 [Propionibacterium sp. oral taxon 192 str. F0372]